MAIKSDWQSGIDKQNLDESDYSERRDNPWSNPEICNKWV